MAKGGKRRRLLVIALISAVVGLTLGYAVARAEETAVCPAGTAKWNADGGCEYGCDRATVTFAGAQVDWQRVAPGRIIGVCVKAGTSLYAPPSGPDGGSFTTPDGKDVSHIVLTLAGPNSVDITGEIVATRAVTPVSAPRNLPLLVLLGALGLSVVYLVTRLLRRK